ncbi:MAG: NAD(P)-binding domain-containing protein, partial [Dehalococcoidia bacterium]|nr:NAD(P)-binding domain-containing protein [Dehalococcoidia bacterium]
MLSDSPGLGMIGFGEVGYHMAKGLKGAGVGQVVAFNNGTKNRPPYTDAFKQKAADIGVVLAATMEELVRGSDIVLSTVVPTAALEIAREASPYLTSSHLFVDLNSCSPKAKEQGRGLVLTRGTRYVDGAIMDRPVSDEHRACIFASGEGARAFHDAMAGSGMNIRVISGKVGDAALLKMIYSIIAKGMQALLLESFETLYRAGLDPGVYDGLNNMVSQSGLL